MSTVRLQIVQAIAAALGTATGLTVYRNLDYALEDRNLPALVVLSREDACEEFVSYLELQANIEIVILVSGSADPEAATDPCEAQVHAALFAPVGFAGHGVVVNRLSGSWNFDLGDCCARHLVYRAVFGTSINSLEV